MYQPQWMYHETLAPQGRLIRSQAEEALLAEDGWFDTPAKFGCNPPAPTEPSLDELLAADEAVSPAAPPTAPIPPPFPRRKR